MRKNQLFILLTTTLICPACKQAMEEEAPDPALAMKGANAYTAQNAVLPGENSINYQTWAGWIFSIKNRDI